MLPNQVSKGELEAAAIAADYAANASTAEEELVAQTMLLRHERALRVGLTKARLQKFTNPAPQHERLPLMEDGHEFGRVAARVPEDLFWALYNQPDFGPEGFFSEEGIRDLNRDYPVCRTKTVSGKTTVGWTGNRPPSPNPLPRGEGTGSGRTRVARPSGVRFGPGVIEFAK